MGSEFILTRASAGSGKTFVLSLRFAEFLLTDRPADSPPDVGQNLPNILAITFTKNASREMKERILEWLKEGYRGEGKKADALLRNLQDRGFPLSRADLSRRAEAAVERILSGYTDFQVDTIDGFASMVFRASAVELGYGPDFEISLNPRELLDYAFARFLRRVKPESAEGEAFRQILEYLLFQESEKTKFLWDPTPKIGEKLNAFQLKLAARPGDLVLEDCSREKERIRENIRAIAARLKKLVDASGLEVAAKGHYAKRVLPAVAEDRLTDLFECSFKTCPVKKTGKLAAGAAGAIQGIEAEWDRLQAQVGALAHFCARDFFLPYLRAYQAVQGEMKSAQRSRGLLFLDDLNRELHRYLDSGSIPDVYLRLGDRIYHYLIDEFQDTSPIQWKILKPLIEESLGRGGSLFLVGDTKQAIYGFRDADFQIMRNLEEGRDGFASTPTTIQDRPTNYRSEGVILDFVKAVFKGLGAGSGGEDGEEADDEKSVDYPGLAALSGLIDFEQSVLPEREGRGCVRYVLLDKKEAAGRPAEETDESGTADDAPEKKEIQGLIGELRERGWRYGDMAILAARNDEVAEAASWLNEIGVAFISFSSLDIRRRKIIGEILSFLRFLDAPPDDLAFSEFLLGDLFSANVGPAFDLPSRRAFLRECYAEKSGPCYTSLHRRYPDLWKKFFEPFFKSVGYLPLYDLVTRMYREFEVFRLFPGEEAALTKLLEAIKGFEGEGRNDLREFIEFSSGDEDTDNEWTIDVPRETDAVKIMSVHKAKGATIPVVICLLYGQRFRGSDFYLQDADDGVHVLKINKKTAEADALLGKIYADARDREWVDKLNSLYVALTRAEYELYLVGVKGKQDRYPFDIMGKVFDLTSQAPEFLPGAARREFELGRSCRREAYIPPEREPGGEPAATGPLQEVDHRSGFSEPSANMRESLNAAGIRRGEWVHRILAGIEFSKAGWPGVIAAALSGLCPSAAEKPVASEAGKLLEGALGKSIDPAWFEPRPGRRTFREFDVCDAGGDIFRMDRVVVDPDSVRIIDFKTGRRPEFADEYRAQIRRYCGLLGPIFPGRPVRGTLSFLDQDRIEEVE